MFASFKKLVPEPIKKTYHFLQALLGALIFLFPSSKLKVIGVTGTDGKTTTVHLIHHILSEAGKRVSMVSTVSAKVRQKSIETGLHVTTPDPIKMQFLLRKMANADSDYCILEVTSHGLAQERTAFVDFFAGVVTNVTHEHLDFHKTYEKYLAAKAKLLSGVKFRILNVDDSSFNKLKEKGEGQLVGYGLKKDSDFQAKKINLLAKGSEFEIHFTDKKKPNKVAIKTNLEGEYNVYNILAAFALTLNLGLDPKQIAHAISNFEGVVGRMQYINEGQDFDVVVDFAHTPAALKRSLQTLKGKAKGKLIAVFGSAGERDIAKRSMMGKVSTELADVSVFTAEDPRHEDVNKIIDEIATGAKNAGGIANRTYRTIPDREKAINYAIQTLATPGDTVVLFGKGHEKSMNISGKEYPWSEEKVARDALKILIKK